MDSINLEEKQRIIEIIKNNHFKFSRYNLGPINKIWGMNKEIALLMIKKDSRYYSNYMIQFNDHSKITKFSLKLNGLLRGYASKRLRNQLKMIITSLKQYVPMCALYKNKLRNPRACALFLKINNGNGPDILEDLII